MPPKLKRRPKQPFPNPPTMQGPTTIGYARVSTPDQSLDMQIGDLRRFGVADANIYSEHASASGKRPKFRLALSMLRPGDTFVVWRLDRLGRSTLGLLKQVQWFQDNGITLVVLHGVGRDMQSAGGKLLLTVLAAAAEFERDMVRERTRAGLARKKERGELVGRKREIDLDQIRRLLRQGYTDREIEARTKFTRQAWYRYIPPTEREKLRDAGLAVRKKRKK